MGGSGDAVGGTGGIENSTGTYSRVRDILCSTFPPSSLISERFSYFDGNRAPKNVMKADKLREMSRNVEKCHGILGWNYRLLNCKEGYGVEREVEPIS